MWSFGFLRDQDSQVATSIDYLHLEYPNNNILLSENAFITSAAFAFSALYGGSRLSVWASHYPAFVETWIRRFCGITMVAAPIITSVVALVRFWDKKLRKDFDENQAFWEAVTAIML